MKRRAAVFILFMILIIAGALANAHTLGTIEIEGLSGRAAHNVRELVDSHIEKTFTINDVEKAMAAVYGLGIVNGIEVFFEEQAGKTNVIFKILPIRMVRSIQYSGNNAYGTLDLTNEFG